MITKSCDEIVILVRCDRVPAHIWAWECDVCETRRAIFIGRLIVKDQYQFTFKPHCDNLRVGVFSEDQILLKTNNELLAKMTATGYIYREIDMGPITEDWDMGKKEFYKIPPQPNSHQMGVERIQVWQYGT